MGIAAYGGKGFKGRAAVSGESPIGTASCRHQHNQVSRQTPALAGSSFHLASLSLAVRIAVMTRNAGVARPFSLIVEHSPLRPACCLLPFEANQCVDRW